MTLEGLIANPFSRLRTTAADGTMAIDRKLQSDMMRLFHEWNSTRIGRFFDVNPRTVQRWLKDSEDPKAMAVPEDLKAMLSEQVEIEAREHFFDEMRDIIGAAQEAGMHPEVILAWLAVLHRDVSDGREIE